MLQAIGVHSTWVMVDTRRGVVAKDAPSILGNHMIAAIELPQDYKPHELYSIVTTKQGKRYLLFDPTWEKTPFGHIESNLQGSYALLVDGTESQALRIPVLKPEQNTIERTSSFKLAKSGEMSGTMHEQRNGDIAKQERYLFSESDNRKQREYLDHIASEDLLSFHIDDIKVNNVRDLGRPLTLDYSLNTDHFAQETGPLLMMRPRVVGNESFATDRPDHEKSREIPIELGAAREVHDRCEIEVPEGYAVDELPRAWDVDLGFAKYSSKVTADGRKVLYDRTYTVRDVEVPADKYADVEKLSRIIATDEQGTAVLKRTKE